MSGPKRSPFARLLALASIMVLVGMAIARTKRSATRPRGATPSVAKHVVDEPHESAVPELVTYAVGYGLALFLTGAAFAVVFWRLATPATALGIVFGLALVQMLVHFRCFLHVDLAKASRDDLQLILFSTMIVLLMVGGTLVVLFNLRMRMM